MESASVEMEIVYWGEVYDDFNGDGVYEYQYTIVVYKVEDKFYRGICQARILGDFNIKLEDISNVILIPTKAYCPLVPSKFTKALEDLSESCYIKRPRLSAYTPSKPTEIGDRVLKEVTVLETLRIHPYPNIAEYIGCQVRNGRIVGIYFVKYRDTLEERLNPGSYGKAAFKYADSKYLLKDREGFLSGVESGIRHLHLLGLVYNDLKPVNIILDYDDNPVIIDFDNCCLNGQDLEGMGGTWPWADEGTKTALPSNDLDALWDIREWLSDSSIKNFKFKEG
jgi:serine/threonine protein kinase